MSRPTHYPPHLFDQVPQDLPPEVLRQAVVRQLRETAVWFRSVQAAGGVGFISADVTLRQRRCGELVAEAHAAGLIPNSESDLTDSIIFHTDPHAPAPAGNVVYARAPENLFHELRGGWFVGTNAAGHLDPSLPSVCGGWMPHRVPGHLSQPQRIQDAETCMVLADLLEIASTPPTRRGEAMGPKDFDFGGGVIMTGFTPGDLALLSAVKEAGPRGLSWDDAARKLSKSVGAVQMQLKRVQDRINDNPNPKRWVEAANGMLVIVTIGRPTKDPQ